MPDNVLNAWKSRESTVKSLYFHVAMNTRTFRNRKGETEDSLKHFEVRLQGNDFDFREDTGDASQRLPLFPHYRSTFDGNDQARFTGASAPGRPGTFLIVKDAEYSDVDYVQLQPIIAHLRPLHSMFRRINIEKCRVVEKESRVGKYTCTVIREEKDVEFTKDVKFQNYWYLDNDREWILVMFVSRINDKISIRQKIGYKETADGLLPWKWDMVHFDTESGQATMEADCQLVEYKLNDDIAGDDLVINKAQIPQNVKILDDGAKK